MAVTDIESAEIERLQQEIVSLDEQMTERNKVGASSRRSSASTSR